MSGEETNNQEKEKEEEHSSNNNLLKNLEENVRNVFICILKRIQNDLASIKQEQTIIRIENTEMEIL